jgi:phosphoribosylformylglycinamidine cyclo-ligase
VTSYRDAGVDLDGAEQHTESIAELVTSTWAEDVVGRFGGFAAGIRVPGDLDDPVLMVSTDGVGTKLEIARRAGLWGGVGYDLVAMCVDDLATAGARPIGFVDYMAVGSLQPDRDRSIVASVAAACAATGCPLLGGETAEHPGVMDRDAIDLAGTAIGAVEATKALGPERVDAGDVVIGLRSPNLRSNGFSLVRAVLGEDVMEHAETLLEPSVIYSPVVTALAELDGVHSAAHITGGGLAGNLARALPAGLGADVDLTAWERPETFELIASYGVSESEMRRTFNLGIGFCLVVAPEAEREVRDRAQQHEPVRIGVVAPDKGVDLQ